MGSSRSTHAIFVDTLPSCRASYVAAVLEVLTLPVQRAPKAGPGQKLVTNPNDPAAHMVVDDATNGEVRSKLLLSLRRGCDPSRVAEV